MAEGVGGTAWGGLLSAADRQCRKRVVCPQEPIVQIKLVMTNNPGADATLSDSGLGVFFHSHGLTQRMQLMSSPPKLLQFK